MPRLPTILVMGSHAISVSPDLSSVVYVVGLGMVEVIVVAPSSPGALRAGGQRRAGCAPLGFLVQGARGHAPEPPDRVAVETHRVGRELAARWLVHERHELVREPGHRAADADTADVGTATDAVHPAPLGHVALDHRPPAAELDDALGRAVLGGEVALLVVARPVAALMHRLSEQPGRAQRL